MDLYGTARKSLLRTLPYNHVEDGHTKPEVSQVIPWFRSAFIRDGQSVMKDHRVSVRTHTCFHRARFRCL
jgi:hypothetical protein